MNSEYLYCRSTNNTPEFTNFIQSIGSDPEVFPSLLGVRQSDIQSLSAEMNMNPKKLQRPLHDEGTSYSQIFDDVRKNLARRLLRDSSMPSVRIALLLDYASDKSFIMAFKRWYNKTPARYRKYGERS